MVSSWRRVGKPRRGCMSFLINHTHATPFPARMILLPSTPGTPLRCLLINPIDIRIQARTAPKACTCVTLGIFLSSWPVSITAMVSVEILGSLFVVARPAVPPPRFLKCNVFGEDEN
ncbi:hypothetical protein BDW66DRAFT_130407 [Aspergillus desertorum]